MEGNNIGVTVTADATGGVIAFDGLAQAVNRFNGVMNEAPGRFANLAAASDRALIPHRAAHQALNLVTRQVAMLGGASAAASGPLRVFDSILFQLGMTGGAVSLPFIAITAAVVGLTSVFVAHHAAVAKTNAEYATLIAKENSLLEATDKGTVATIKSAEAMLQKLEAQLLIQEKMPTNWDKIKSYGVSALDAVGKGAGVVNRAIESILFPGAVTFPGLDALSAKLQAANPIIDETRKKIEAQREAIRKLGDIAQETAHKEAQAFSDDIFEKQLVGARKAEEALESFTNTTKESAFQALSYVGGLWEGEAGVVSASLTKEIAAITKHYDSAIEAAKKANVQVLGLESAKNTAIVAAGAKTQLQIQAQQKSSFGLQSNVLKDFQKLGLNVANTVATSFGNAFAKMIVDGATFSDVMTSLWKQIASQVIAEIVAMGVRYALYEAVKAIQAATGAGEQVLFASAANYLIASSAAWVAAANAYATAAGIPGLAEARAAQAFSEVKMMAVAAGALKMAVGGDFLVDQPTRLLVGEGGQSERVTVTPLSKSSTTNSTANVTNINIGNISLPSVKNPRDFIDQLALLVTQNIRGRGQLNLVGKGIF